MALFKKDKEETKEAPKKEVVEKKTEKKEAPKKIVDLASGEDLSWVLISPRITEKAADKGSDSVYTFNVATKANKVQIKKAVKKLYNVDPIKVNIITIPSKTKRRRGIVGETATAKKAMVFLKKGQSIEFA
jgi:large subunit ribosomal protein L23